MTATNHALTGAAIGLAMHGSWLALPLAFVSHFAVDAIPHFGGGDRLLITSNQFRLMLIIDGLLAILLALGIMLAHPANWWVVDLSAFAAASPDLMWIGRFVQAQRGQKQIPIAEWNWLMRFHSKIQWYEKPRGAIIEGLWFVLCGGLVLRLLH